MLPIKARHLARGLAIAFALFHVEPLIAYLLALADAKLGFDSSIFPIKLQHHEGSAGDIRQAVKFVDLTSMKQELANSFRRRHFVAGAFIWLDVRPIDKGFAILDSREGVADVGLAGPDRFDLAAF